MLCRKPKRRAFWADKFCDLGLESQPITEVPAGTDRADFISKIGITVEEADETVFWLESLIDAKIVKQTRLEKLLAEANELVRIFAATRATAKSR